MAGMNLNPYNLNNNNQRTDNSFNNNYSGFNINKGLTDDQRERIAARSQYMQAYGLKNTDPNHMDLNKPQEKPKKSNYLIIIFGLAILGVIILIISLLIK